jgi:hypothetical protein
LLAQFTFLVGLHAIDMISGAPWSPIQQYRIFLESVLLVVMRPVEKFATVLYFIVCTGVVPFIWFLSTVLSTESTMPTMEPQVVMLPLVFIIMLFVVERSCHYRLLFLALEFVQWSRLQREELESLFQCGRSVYGAVFDKGRLGSHTLLDGVRAGPRPKDPSSPHKRADGTGTRRTHDETTSQNAGKGQKMRGGKASAYLVDIIDD